MIFVERLQLVRDRVLVVEALGHQYRHSLRERHAAHDEKLKHVIEACRVRHSLLHYGAYLPYVSQRLGGEHALPRLHPPPVAPHGVYLAVVAKQAEGLRQFPLGKRVGRETGVYQCQSAREAGIAQVAVVSAQLPRGKHTFIDDVLAGKGADVEILIVLRAFLYPLAYLV